jgi:hypothetical protein
MALKKGDRNNFDTLLTAARNGHLALLECQDKATGEYRAVICAVHHCKITPIGHLTTGNPFDIYIPPMQESA